MKRDLQLIRKILLEIEASNLPHGLIDLKIPDLDPQVVSYHVRLLAQAGLIDASNLSSQRAFEWKPRSLTWSGHEFLDSARNDTVWSNAMERLKATASSAPLEVVKAVLIQSSKEFFGLGQ